MNRSEWLFGRVANPAIYRFPCVQGVERERCAGGVVNRHTSPDERRPGTRRGVLARTDSVEESEARLAPGQQRGRADGPPDHAPGRTGPGADHLLGFWRA